MGLSCSDNSVDITDFSFDVSGQGDDRRLHQRDATDSRGDLGWVASSLGPRPKPPQHGSQIVSRAGREGLAKL